MLDRNRKSCCGYGFSGNKVCGSYNNATHYPSDRRKIKVYSRITIKKEYVITDFLLLKRKLEKISFGKFNSLPEIKILVSRIPLLIISLFYKFMYRFTFICLN